jgi:hypothetical protein
MHFKGAKDARSKGIEIRGIADSVHHFVDRDGL